jgi:hypothetical protein
MKIWPLITIIAMQFSGCSDSSDDSTQVIDHVQQPSGAPSIVTKSVQSTDADVVTMCGDAGGVKLHAGIDENLNGRLDVQEIDDTHIICHGQKGEDGISTTATTNIDTDTFSNEVISLLQVAVLKGDKGDTTLFISTPIERGQICNNGGIELQHGLDLNHDNILQAHESNSSNIICNGSDGDQGIQGVQGIQGIQGIQGVQGLKTLFISKSLANTSSNGQVLKTGQTTSYTTLDDGDSERGIARSFTRDDTKNIVTDNVTALIWQDDTALVSQAGMSHADALTYCSNLSLGDHTDWRLPNIKELNTLTNYGATKPSLYSDFQNYPNTSTANVGSWGDIKFWSSTLDVASTQYNMAFFVDIDIGRSMTNDVPRNGWARCVRGDELNMTTNTMTRDNDGIVTDSTTGIMWQDNYSDNGDAMKSVFWAEAITYCDNLSLGGHTDWTLPNANEMKTILDYNRSAPTINPAFTFAINDVDSFWTSTTQKHYTVEGEDTNAAFVGLFDANSPIVYSAWKVEEAHPAVRCMRINN